MAFVAGIDSSTQSCKVVIYDPETQQVVRQGSAKHPDGTEIHPIHWWTALQEAVEAAGGLHDVEAMSVGGQQHGMVCLNAEREVIRPALLWNDTRSAKAAEDLVIELGGGNREKGAKLWANTVGFVPVASITVTKLRWLAENEPENTKQLAAVCLPHDWLTWKLMGSPSLDQLATDRSDASGTGYLDCHSAEYRYDLLQLGLDPAGIQAENIILPKVAKPWDVVGETNVDFAKGIKLGPGCGDNAAAALGLGLEPGEASLSLGTSGVVAAVSDEPVCDPSGLVTGFMDATGRWLPLACTLNGSRIVDAMAKVLGVDYQTFDALALEGPEGADGIKLIPYFEGERTPNLPEATATLEGMTLANCTPQHVARASIEGMINLMGGAMQAVVNQNVPIERIKLIGGGAKSKAVQQLAEPMLGYPVDMPEAAEYVAVGAAKQASRLKG